MIPAVDDAEDDDDRRERQHGQRKPVDPDVIAGVDYVVTGNIFMPFGYDTSTVNIQFTKISGKDVTTKFIISISINKEGNCLGRNRSKEILF